VGVLMKHPVDLNRVRLRNVKHSCRPRPTKWFPFPGFFVFSRHLNERDNLDAVLAASYLSAQRTPSLIGKDVFSRLDLGFGNALRDESAENGRIVTEAQAVDCATERFYLFDFPGMLRGVLDLLYLAWESTLLCELGLVGC